MDIVKNSAELITYSVTDAEIAKYRSAYMGLQVKGVNDKDGYASCRSARLEVKEKRVGIEHRRKELKAQSLEFGRKVDAEAKRISEPLEEIEAHLKSQEEIVENEEKRLKELAETQRRERMEKRMADLHAIKVSFLPSAVESLSDEDFAALLQVETEKYKAALQAAADEAERVRKLEAERAEQAAKIRAQEEETRRLQAELLAKQQAEIAEKNRQLQEAAQREQDEKVKAAREQAERERAEAQRIAAERAEKAKQEAAAIARELEAQARIADQKLFESIKAKFPTLESAWVEIARLTKFAKVPA